MSGGHSSSRCVGLTIAASLVAEHRLQMRQLSSCGSRASCFAACGIFPDQGSNPCPLHWQADSQPLRHQGSPGIDFFLINLFILFLAALGIRCCTQASSSCGKRGPLFIAVRRPHYRGLSLRSTGSRHEIGRAHV